MCARGQHELAGVGRAQRTKSIGGKQQVLNGDNDNTARGHTLAGLEHAGVVAELDDRFRQELTDRVIVNRGAQQKQTYKNIECRDLAGVVEHLFLLALGRWSSATDMIRQVIGVVAAGVEKRPKLTHPLFLREEHHCRGSLTEYRWSLVSCALICKEAVVLKTFREALRSNDFVVTANLPLQPTTTVTEIESATNAVATAVDALQLIDDREAVGHMSTLVAATVVVRNGVDAILHLTARDRNRVALQADLLGAAALGITSLVITRGEKLSRKGFLRGKGVFDTQESRLMEMAGRIGEESGLVSPPGFLIGTYVSAFSPGADWGAGRIDQSIDTGASFLQTQPCLNAGVLKTYAQKLVELKVTHRAALIVEVPLLHSAEAARNYKSRYPSALIPDGAISEMSAAGDELEAGIALCKGMLDEARSLPGVAGASIRYEGPVDQVSAISAAVGTA